MDCEDDYYLLRTRSHFSCRPSVAVEIILEVVVRIAQGGLLAWFWRMGGKLDKNYRRILAPILVLIITRNVFVTLLVAGTARIPITLINGDLKVWGQLYWWAPVLCALQAIPVLLVAGVWSAVGLFVLQYAMILGSNLIEYPKWNWYEKVYGFALGVVLK